VIGQLRELERLGIRQVTVGLGSSAYTSGSFV
jgi:hypothetical protein